MLNEVRGLPEVIGGVYPVQRFETGLWSFDRALGFRGDNGVPLRSIFELYGFEHSGKSTLAYFLAAKISEGSTIWVADLEGTPGIKEYIAEVTANAGFGGTVHIAEYTEKVRGKEKLRSHEAQFQDVVDALLEPEVTASIVDSIGMFQPIAERNKDLGERTMGHRAMLIANASRRTAAWLRIVDDPKLMIFINHVHRQIGSMRAGWDTPGGQTKKYAANIRVWLQRIDNDIPDGSGNFLAEARVQKLKFGGASSARKGLVYFIPGYGVSKQLTDVMDCVRLKLAKREATIKLLEFNDKKGEDEWISMGRLGTLAQKALEPSKHTAVFQRFENALKRHEQADI